MATWRVAVLTFLITTALPAQAARVDIVLPAVAALATDPPSVRTIGIASASHTAELIRNGFPAALHYKLERWAAGTFVNNVRATVEWDVYVEYDALESVYRIFRATSDRPTLVGKFATIKEADAELAEPYRVAISLPKRGEKSYYALTVDVEALSLTDLDEVRRWLRGELRPALHAKRNPGTAVTSGLRTALVRILGGERLQYKASTGVFRP